MDEIAETLSSPVWVWVAGVFGAIWGSFLNVCIARIPLGQSIVRPGSRCMSCGAPVLARHNIPIVSYFVLRGRCRVCRQRFSPRYALVELLVALLAAALFWNFVTGDPAGALGVRLARFSLYFAFSAVLLVLSFIDLDTKRLPDVITLPSIPIFFLAAFGAQDVNWIERAIGLVAGYLFVRLIADAYYYLLKREGLGLGDGKLLSLVGAVLGWKALPFVLFVGSFLGVLVAVPVLLLARRRSRGAADDAAPLRHVEVPFGPFLAMAAEIYLFVGPALVERLLGAA